MRKSSSIHLLLPAFLLLCVSPATARTIQDFDANWLFTKGDSPTSMMPALNDTGWAAVTLPHDWSSDGPFTADFASGNGYAPGGIGWYRKHFQIDTNQAGACVALEFDGIYDNSEIWVNGQFAGGRPYGYSSFQCDVTPFVKFGGDNLVAVRVDHSRFADSRYYTGSGIYRNVRLVIADKLHIAYWGVSIATPKIKPDSATIHIETTVENNSSTNKTFMLETDLITPDGKIATTAKTKANLGAPASGTAQSSGAPSTVSARTTAQDLILLNPLLWNLDAPNLYCAVTKIISGKTILDQVTNTFGIREFHFDPNQGFFLNAQNLKIKGVCLHHDAGPIGAAVPDKVLAPAARAERNRRQRHPHQPQSARPRAPRFLRPSGLPRYGRGV